MKWSKEEIDYLIIAYSSRVSLKDISNKLGRTVKSIVNKATRLSIIRSRKKFDLDKKKKRQKKADSIYFQRNKKEIYKKRNTRFFEIKKELANTLGGKCNYCGYFKCVAALEFHHKSNNKDENVTKMIKDASKQKALKEAKKCILLCANCHRELHFNKGV